MLFNGSHALEHHLTEASQEGLSDLFKKTPQMATRVELNPDDNSPLHSTEQEVNAAALAIHDTILVKNNERVSA